MATLYYIIMYETQRNAALIVLCSVRPLRPVQGARARRLLVAPRCGAAGTSATDVSIRVTSPPSPGLHSRGTRRMRRTRLGLLQGRSRAARGVKAAGRCGAPSVWGQSNAVSTTGRSLGLLRGPFQNVRGSLTAAGLFKTLALTERLGRFS